MEKGSYRRVSAGRTDTRRSSLRKPQQEEKSDVRETILMQCIVSGIILGCMLLLCTIKTSFTSQLRQSLKVAISDTASLTDLYETAGETGQTISTVQKTIMNLFGGTSTVPEEAQDVFLPAPTQNTQPTAVTSPAQTDQTNFRIDEDILNEMNTRTDPYGNAEKKFIVPAQSPTPEQVQ